MDLDSNKLEIRLPADKLARLQTMLKDWEGKKAVKKRDLLSLIGYLHHASKAVRQGRSFLRRLIHLSTLVKSMDGYVRLNLSARADIRWWSIYASQWNGTSMMARLEKDRPQHFVTSDASGSWGCGAILVPAPVASYDGGMPYIYQRNDSSSHCSHTVGWGMAWAVCAFPVRQLSCSSPAKLWLKQGQQFNAPNAMPHLYLCQIQLCDVRVSHKGDT